MRKVLAIIAAITLAAVVLLPATGYSISSGSNQSYSIQSTPASYSISMGQPAHNLTPGSIPAAVSPTSAVKVTRVPYSIKLGAAVPYSMKLVPGASAAPQTALLGSQVQSAAPTVQETPTIQPPAEQQNVSIPAPAPAKFSIMGVVFNDVEGNGAMEAGEMGLENWMVNLEEPSGAVIANATTNSNGSYSFNDLNAGTYVVSEILAPGWVAVAPVDGKYTVNLTENMTELNFANMEMPAENVTAPSNATIEAPPTVTMPEAAAANATQINSTIPK